MKLNKVYETENCVQNETKYETEQSVWNWTKCMKLNNVYKT